MGNHEYNTLAYARESPDGSFLRSHDEKHNKQHKATLEQFANDQEEWESYLEWFYELPLFLDLPELRVVHACWNDDHIKWLQENNYYTLTGDLLVAFIEKILHEFKVIEETLKRSGNKYSQGV